MGAQTSKRLALRETARIRVTDLFKLTTIAWIHPKKGVIAKLTSESLVISLGTHYKLGNLLTTTINT